VARLLLRIKGAAGPRPRELRSVPVSAPRAATGRKAVRSPQPQRHATQHAFAAAEAAVPFRVSWGARQGADARKLLAIVCRRGRIRGTEVGAIRIDADHSIVEVQAGAAEAFAVHAARPDPRAPRLRIGLWRPHNQGHEPGDRSSITPDKHRGSATPNRNGGHKPPRRRA
jgi:ATP-dependent RNA helicase DeaD